MNVSGVQGRHKFATLNEEREWLLERIRVERGLRAFVLSGATWTSRADFVAALVRRWYLLLERECVLYERPSDESQCSDGCLGTYNSIVTLCENVQLYGCVRHGTLHRCDRRSCKSQIVNREWSRICMFSGVQVGKEFAAVASLSAEYRNNPGRAGFKTVIVGMQSSVVGSFHYAGSPQNISDQIDRGEEISVRPSVTVDGKPGSAIRRPTTEERRSFRFGRKVGDLTVRAEEELVTIAGNVVNDVLFNAETRDMFNIQMIDQTRRKAHQNVLDYFSRTRMDGGVPNRVTAAAAYATPLRTIVLLPIVPEDVKRRADLVVLCTRLWQLCHRTPYAKRIREAGNSRANGNAIRKCSCTFVQFCVAVMFMQRDGLVRRNSEESCFVLSVSPRVFIPVNARMCVDLPLESDLDAFGRLSTERMRAHIASTDEQRTKGSSKSVQENLFNGDGTRRMRRARTKRRRAMSTSGKRQIKARGSMTGDLVTTERNVLPPHLHGDLHGKCGTYEQSDVTQGRRFIEECINSIPPNDIESEASAIAE